MQQIKAQPYGYIMADCARDMLSTGMFLLFPVPGSAARHIESRT